MRERHSYQSWLWATVLTSSIVIATPVVAGEAKKNHVKATIEHTSWDLLPNATAATGSPPDTILSGLNGSVLETYDDLTLVEIDEKDKEKLKQRGRERSVLITLEETFDQIFLNRRVLDAREGPGKFPPGDTPDPPYLRNEQGSWLIQFVGPIKDAWLDAVRAAGVVLVQPVPKNAYIVAARESSMGSISAFRFIQWTSQMHRFLKPSMAESGAETVELWIEVAQTDETTETIDLLSELAVEPIETAPWSESETRVQGVFRSQDVPLILALPLVFMLDEKPQIALSGERSALALTDLVAPNALPASAVGKYKKWLSDACPACESTDPAINGMDLLSDGFYVGIADTGLDGGDRAASGNLPGELGSSGLRRPELQERPGSPPGPKRVIWGQSFEETAFASGETWSACIQASHCPDTTQSKHDMIGHGTVVAAVAAGDPPANGGKDGDGFFWALGVAPSAGIAVTKINSANLMSRARPVGDVTRDARSLMEKPVYWQNFSLNQYQVTPAPSGTSDCNRMYDGRYSLLSRDFDQAVIDADRVAADLQPITLTVSSGNANLQPDPLPSGCSWIDRTLTLPPATAKNVIAVGGGEVVRPDPWFCGRARADSYANLAFDAKHGTAVPGWYKPDLIAVSSNISTVKSNDQVPAYGCTTADTFNQPPYFGGTGTSFAAPVALGAAALASRRFSSNPASARPALVKAMLIAGAESMRGGSDRARMTNWRPGRYNLGDRVIPTTPNEHFYEVELVEGVTATQNPNEPHWPEDGGVVVHQAHGNVRLTWRDKGSENTIAAAPNAQQGFGRIHLKNVLSDYPAREYVNDEPLPAGNVWSRIYTVHDSQQPVRIALVWTDPPGPDQGAWGTSTNPPPAPASPLINNLNLSARLLVSGNCVGRYVGNVVGADDNSIFHSDCSGGTPDNKNNAEIIRFHGGAGTTFQVNVAAAAADQAFSLVVWNAYTAAQVPPATPSSLTAKAVSASQVALTWPSVGAPLYQIHRSLGIYDPYVKVGETSATTFTDAGVASTTTYLYRVRAVDGTQVSDWVVDSATTTVFSDPFLAGVPVRAAHINELRAAVGAMRTAAGASPVTWFDHPFVIAGSTSIRSAHVSDLRTALLEARAALSLPLLTFADGTLTPGASVVKAVHIQELRGGVE